MVMRFRGESGRYMGMPLQEFRYDDVRERIWLSIKSQQLYDQYLGRAATYRIAEDYFAVCRIPMVDQTRLVTSCVVEFFQLDRWGIGPEELFEQALTNQRRHPVYLCDMAAFDIYCRELLAEIPKDLLSEEIWQNIPELMLLSHGALSSFGSHLMCDGAILRKIREKVGGFYLFPVSEHELAVAPARDMPDFEDVRSMISKVRRFYTPDSFLGTDVEYFDPLSDRLVNASKTAGGYEAWKGFD